MVAAAHTGMLVLLVCWHAAFIAVPMAAAVLWALRLGVHDLLLLGLYALIGGGFTAYALFWIWWLSPGVGAWASAGVIVAGGASIPRLWARLDRPTLAHAAPLAAIALAWLAYAIFLLAFGLGPLGLQSPLVAVQHDFGLSMPNDNALPLVFAQQIATGHVTRPMSGEWLSSDRPPLQTGYVLASLAVTLPRAELHYQVQSTLLQALWVPGTWLLLRALGVAGGALLAALFAGMFSGFAFVHGLFTWPKLFPVAHMAIATGILLAADGTMLANRHIAAGLGACIAFAMLCHPGVLFVLGGVATMAVALGRLPPMRSVAIAATAAFVIALPWLLYQRFVDPPGNRLLKWHLAGAISPDDKSLAESLRNAYGWLTLENFVAFKLENLKTVTGPVAESAALVAKASTIGIDEGGVRRLRVLQFFHIGATLGVLALAPLAWLVPRARRTRAFTASLLLFGVCVPTVILWVLVMFIPASTSIHAGSLTVVCFLFAAATLAFFAVSPWLAAIAVTANAALTLRVYSGGATLLAGVGVAEYHAFEALAAVALAASCVALLKASRAPNH